jgi:inositol transport system permease protein
MNLIGVNSYIQSIIEGAIIVLAVAFDIRSKSRKQTKQIMAVKDEAPKA